MEQDPADPPPLGQPFDAFIRSGASSMFIDLDRPPQRDPMEEVVAMIEWDEISEMYEDRDRMRKGSGFIEDRHRVRTFLPSGAYALGFNPPRSITKPKTIYDLPPELNAMIVKNIQDPRQIQATRAIDVRHRDITMSIGDRVEGLVSGYVEKDERVDMEISFDEMKQEILLGHGLHHPKCKGKKERQMDIVQHVYTEMLKGIPIAAIRSSKIHMFLEYKNGQPYREALQIMRRYNDLDLYHNDFAVDYPEFWKHYPFVKAIFMEIARKLGPSIKYDTSGADKAYRRYYVQ